MVMRFSYLESLTTNKEGGLDAGIKRRLAIGRNATIKLSRIWKDSEILQHNELKLLSILFFSFWHIFTLDMNVKNDKSKKNRCLRNVAYRRMLLISYKPS